MSRYGKVMAARYSRLAIKRDCTLGVLVLAKTMTTLDW